MKKILLIRLSSIGDIVLTTPVIRCLKKQRDVEIHFLTKEKFKPVLAHNPYLHTIHAFQKSVSEVSIDLKKEQFHYVIDLHNNLRSWQVLFLLNFPTTYTFSKVNFRKWLLVNFKINRMPPIHIVDRYLKAAEALGVQNDGAGLDYFLPKEMKIPSGQYSVFAIGATHATKRLPTEKIIEWCEVFPQKLVLIGGQDVAVEGQKIANVAGTHVNNQCGKCNLHESAAWIKGAQKVITHDTGMMHIAAAFHKEIVSIWGNTVPSLGMYPYYPNGIDRNTTMEVPSLSCRPCSKIGFKKCPKGHFDCMNKQSTERFLGIVERIK